MSEDYIMEISLFERMGVTYHREGDYFLPDLLLLESISVGIWSGGGRMT